MSNRVEIIEQLQDIHPLSNMTVEAMALAHKADVQIEEIKRLIAKDPGLSAKILRIANSPFFGMARTIDTLQNAIVVLGTQSVCHIILATCIKESLSQFEHTSLDPEQFWKHCNITAAMSAVLASQLQLDRDQAYLVGLLHDIGRLVLCAKYPDILREVKALHLETDHTYISAEQELMGIDHAEAGAILGDKWNFPPHFVSAIRQHHQPDNLTPSIHLIVHAANIMSYTLDCGSERDLAAPPLTPGALDALELTDDHILDLLKLADNTLNELCSQAAQ